MVFYGGLLTNDIEKKKPCKRIIVCCALWYVGIIEPEPFFELGKTLTVNNPVICSSFGRFFSSIHVVVAE